MALETVLMTIWINFIASLPGLIAALITLIIGLVVGKVVGKVVKELFTRLKIDEYVLEDEKHLFKFSMVSSLIARWWIYLVFIQQATVFLGIVAISNFVNSIIGFLPGLIEAAVIVIVGSLLAEYIKDKLVSKKTFYGAIVGKLIFFLLVYVSIALALPFIGIDTMLINWILLIIIGSVGVGMAIAIGLGMKDVVASVAKDYVGKAKRRR
ncbi:MAG: hypothetical protein KJ697_03165 [Nanoarchaeota archaeon]|nr:hypothetical protein [Nanoarchaeota archaeon]